MKASDPWDCQAQGLEEVEQGGRMQVEQSP